MIEIEVCFFLKSWRLEKTIFSFAFLEVRLGLEHISCNLSVSHLAFKWHHAALENAEQCLFLHFPFFMKPSRVIYLVKLCVLDRPQIKHFPFLTFTTFCVLGFTFSYSIISIVIDLCLPPTQKVCSESIYINEKFFQSMWGSWLKVNIYFYSRV